MLLILELLLFVLGLWAVVSREIPFAYIFFLAAMILSIIVARNTRRSEDQRIDDSQRIAPSSRQNTSSYGLRLLIFFGIVVLGFITMASAGALIGTIVSSITVGTRLTGNFWEDIFPFILMTAVTGIGLFGILKLVQLLRRKP